MRKPFPAGALFFGAVTTALFGATMLCAYETYALATGKKPITQHTRLAYHEYPKVFGISLLAIGALLGHLFWAPPDTKNDDEAA